MLITAAIVVPIVLIVLPRQQQAAANASGSSNLGDCPNSAPCENGGISIVSGGGCRCICANGFAGDRCGTVADPACVTIDVKTSADGYTNAILGNAIPRLLSGASADYSVPLNNSAILILFSTNNLSCTSENALVLFESPGVQARDIAQKVASENELPSAIPASPFQPTPTSTSTSTPTPTPTPPARVASRLEQRQIETSNGIVFQMTATAVSSLVSSSPPSSATSTSDSPSSEVSSESSDEATSPETIDFARIVVLFVLEQTGQLSKAINAQDSLQEFLLGRTNRSEIFTLGSEGIDLSLNFGNFSIILGNGTELGGRGDGNGGFQ